MGPPALVGGLLRIGPVGNKSWLGLPDWIGEAIISRGPNTAACMSSWNGVGIDEDFETGGSDFADDGINFVARCRAELVDL